MKDQLLTGLAARILSASAALNSVASRQIPQLRTFNLLFDLSIPRQSRFSAFDSW
jgi:hypothetical protein